MAIENISRADPLFSRYTTSGTYGDVQREINRRFQTMKRREELGARWKWARLSNRAIRYPLENKWTSIFTGVKGGGSRSPHFFSWWNGHAGVRGWKGETKERKKRVCAAGNEEGWKHTARQYVPINEKRHKEKYVRVRENLRVYIRI